VAFFGIVGISSTIAWVRVLLALFAVLFILSLLVRLVWGGGHSHTHLYRRRGMDNQIYSLQLRAFDDNMAIRGPSLIT
jgi:hypothetical protein